MSLPKVIYLSNYSDEKEYTTGVWHKKMSINACNEYRLNKKVEPEEDNPYNDRLHHHCGCGNILWPHENYCPNCGAELIWEDSPEENERTEAEEAKYVRDSRMLDKFVNNVLK